MIMKKIQFRLTAYTDAAGKRNEELPLFGNEDNFFVDADLSDERQGSFSTDECQMLSDFGSLLVIADGMGGMNAGEVASEIAINTVKKFFAHDALRKDLPADCKSRERYMERVVVEADAAIKSYAREHKECEGMGSTIVMVWVCGNSASVTWCGDSRAYLFREPAGIMQLSKDHSYVQSLVDDGKITDDEAFDHPYGNIITRSLGDPDKKAQPESRSLDVFKGDIILVCSDGLSGVLRDRKSFDRDGNPRDCDNIEDIIRNNRSSMLACREALWDAAEKAEWYDNVTAILYEITDGDKAPEGAEAVVNDRGGTKSKKLLACCISLLFVIAAVCGIFIWQKNRHKVPEEWNAEIDGVSNAAAAKNLNFILGKLQELKAGDTEGLSEIERLMEERIAVLTLLDSVKTLDFESVPDSLYRIVESDSSSVRLDSLRSVFTEKVRILNEKKPSEVKATGKNTPQKESKPDNGASSLPEGGTPEEQEVGKAEAPGLTEVKEDAEKGGLTEVMTEQKDDKNKD